MILTSDVGNTNIKCGLFSDHSLKHSFRMSTNIDKTSDEYGISLISFLDYIHVQKQDITGVIISSVIPSLNYTIEHMMRLYFGQKPMFVSSGLNTGLKIKYDNPAELGADRIVNAVAAFELFGGPVITIDFGTATTFGAISKDGEFLGGAICPGIKISAEALTISAAKLPRIELLRPKRAINKNTVAGMQAGILYGYAGQVQHIVNMMKEEMGGAKVVATGGFSELVSEETGVIDVVLPTLTLLGLEILYSRNNKEV